MPVKTIGREHGILSSTLKGHVYGTTLYTKRSRKGVLSIAKEAWLVDYLIKMQKLGFPFTIGQLQSNVGVLIQERVIPFRDGVLGSGWVKCFIRRQRVSTKKSPIPSS